ncbi:hypothetical protein BMF94_2423 [Rhodotorula taiwanensis]|uniref:Uncharacterized protein n=1 Tax=Rhodotorula taiwanensis TaxID=741276 RepID=A0A2S5BD44_9BASI|nr:hypothetical protein BMF94_2423 [Rhodotorula taiwanensis]
MSMRRVARNGLGWTDRAASASRVNRAKSRSLSHAVSLDPIQHSHGHTQHHGQAANAHTWDNLSNAATRVIFDQAGTTDAATLAGDEQHQLEQVQQLVHQLKRPRPDAARCWALFHELDSQGLAANIPLVSLHALLAAIHSPAPRSLSIEKATALARDYTAKVDLIRLRIQQAGGATSQGDYRALLGQYRAFKYAPGAMRTWDEMINAGDAPSPLKCRLVFETLAAWVELHGRDAGRAVERAAAQPLAREATRILLKDIGIDAEHRTHIDRAVEPYLELVAKSGDFSLLTKAVKALYGFDIRLPGALVDLPAATRAHLRSLGERELYWILVGLGQANELSTMVAVFETFDSPDPATLPEPSAGGDPASFFSSTFSNLSLSSNPAQVDSQPVPPATREKQSHLIGTRALQIMVETAARLDQPALVRHYFDLLFCRWEAGVGELLASWERTTGLAASEAATDSTFAAAPPAPWLGSPFARSLTSIKHRHLARAPSAPEQPYRLPVSLVMLVGQYSYTSYQAATSKWNRIRTKRIVQVLEDQAARLERVLEQLEPTEAAAVAVAVPARSPAAGPVASTSAATATATVSLARVLREFRKVTTDLALLRETLATVKHNNRIVHTADARHLQQYELSLVRRKSAHLARSTSRRGGAAAGGGGGGSSTTAIKDERARLERLEAKRARKVDIWTARLAKHRIDKMVKVEGRGAGDPRFDGELKKLIELREKLVPGHARPTTQPGQTDAPVELVASPRSDRATPPHLV